MKFRIAVVAAIVTLMSVPNVSADVMIKSKVLMSILGAGSTETSRTEYFRNDRTYAESYSTPVSGLMARLNNKPQKIVTVTRLDKGVIWSLNEQEKGYMETPLDTIKARMEGNGTKAIKSPLLGTSTNPEDYKWRVTIKKITEPTRMGWAECTGLIAKGIGVNRTNENDKVLITYEQWFADIVPGKAVYDTYQDSVKKVLGSDSFAEQKQVASMLSVLGDEFEPIFDSLKSFTGVPIKLNFTVEKSTLFGFTEEQYDKGLADSSNQQLQRINNMIGGKPPKTEDGMFKSFSIESDVSKIEGR